MSANVSASSHSSHKVHIVHLHRFSFCMDTSKDSVLKQLYQIHLSSFLQSLQSHRLHPALIINKIISILISKELDFFFIQSKHCINLKKIVHYLISFRSVTIFCITSLTNLWKGDFGIRVCHVFMKYFTSFNALTSLVVDLTFGASCNNIKYIVLVIIFTCCVIFCSVNFQQ